QPAPTGRDAYRFIRGSKTGLSPAAICYACADYLAMADPDSRTATLTRLAADPGSPGRLMKLTEDVILDALEQTARTAGDIHLGAPAGITQLALDAPPARVAKTVLWLHHSERRPDVPLPTGDVAGPAARSAQQASLFALTAVTQEREGAYSERPAR